MKCIQNPSLDDRNMTPFLLTSSCVGTPVLTCSSPASEIRNFSSSKQLLGLLWPGAEGKNMLKIGNWCVLGIKWLSFNKMQELVKRFFTLLFLGFESSLVFLFSAEQNTNSQFSPYPPVCVKPLTTQVSLKKRLLAHIT